METAKDGSTTKADHEHVAAIKAGSPTSWGKLYERHMSALVRFCGNFTADPNLAEEWAQESFVRLKEKAHTFQDGAELKPWLFKVARNICIEHRRKHREIQWTDSVFASCVVNFASLTTSPSAQIVASEVRAKVRQVLAILSEEHRTVVLLKHVEGLSRKEIAEVMDVPEATVKSRLFYAMLELQQRLKGL